MGNQRLIQTQTATNDRKQHLDKRTKQPEHPMQEVLGSRAASRHFRAQLQRHQAEGASGPNPLHSILPSISPVSPRMIQAKPMFRGLSHELTSALDSRGVVIQAKMTIHPSGDKYEQEADRVAQQVVQRLNAPQVGRSQPEQSVQRETLPEEADKLQMKPILQRHGAIETGEASTDLASAINRARGSGQPLDAGLQRSMGQAMGADFSGVRVREERKEGDRRRKDIEAN